MKFISILSSTFILLLFSCSKKENDISINIYKTERADKVYNILMECDSITKDFLTKRKVDTSSLSLIELVDVLNTPQKAISGSLFDVYHYVSDSNFYQFNSRAFVGSAYYIDTLKLREWLNDQRCLRGQKLPFTYKWLADPTDSKKLRLVGLRAENPFIIFRFCDVDLIKLSAEDGISKLKEDFAGTKSAADSYSLEVVLKPEHMERLRSEIKDDDSSGFFAVVQSGRLSYVTEIRFSEILKTNSIRVTEIDKNGLAKFQNEFGTEIDLIEE